MKEKTKLYKTYKFLGREIKVERKPLKFLSVKWGLSFLKFPFTRKHQPGWEYKDDKYPMPWNIYTEGLTRGEHHRRFDYTHTVLKYSWVYPLFGIFYNWFIKPKTRKGLIVDGSQIKDSQEIHNVPLKVFEKAWSLAEDDWIKYYLCRYNAPLNSYSKKKHSDIKNGKRNALPMLRFYKQMAYTIVKYDTAYREFFIPLLLRTVTEFNKEYSENPLEHVMYLSKNVHDLRYPLASEVLYRFRNGKPLEPMTNVPARVPDMPNFNPNLQTVKDGKVRFKPEFKVNHKTKELEVNTAKFKILINAGGGVDLVPKDSTHQEYLDRLKASEGAIEPVNPEQPSQLTIDNPSPGLLKDLKKLFKKHKI